MTKPRDHNEYQTPSPKQANKVSYFRISDLPISMLLIILSKLPIGVIKKCMLVCKLWFNLLSEPSFTDYYAKNSIFTHLLLPEDLDCYPSNTLRLFLIEISQNGGCMIRIPRVIKLKLPVWVERESLEYIIGSCYGLIISALRGPEADLVYISQPLTGGRIELPEYKTRRRDEGLVYFKLGFIPTLDKFKVVRFSYRNSKVDTCAIITVGVDDGWRRLECTSTGWWFWADWICLNGTFYWIVGRSGSFRIATFDLVEENFGQIGPPGLQMNSKRVKLMLLNARLAVVDLSSPLQFTLWTMSDDAFATCWKQDVILRSWFPSAARVNKLIPVEELRNGDILFGDSVHFFSVNVKRRKCSKIEGFQCPDVDSCINDIMTYRPWFRSFWEAVMEGQGSTLHFQSDCSDSDEDVSNGTITSKESVL